MTNETNPTSETFKEGDAVFCENGTEAIYVTETSDGGHIVQTTMSDGETYDCYPGEYLHVDRVLKTPPVQKYGEEIQKMIARLSDLNEQIKESDGRLAAALLHEKKLKERLGEHKALKHIDEFLKCEMTHFVFNKYGRITIEEKEAALKVDGYHSDRKLVALFGRSKGDLLWKCNRYYDGSGDWQDFIPCMSRDEAIEVARKMIGDTFAKWRVAKKEDRWRHGLNSTAESAKKLGFDVPRDIVSIIRDNAIKDATKKLADRSEEMKKAQQVLADAEGAKP